MTIFKRIINKEIPAQILYEDDLCLAFRDIRPQAPFHILLIPKKEIQTIQDLTQEDQILMGHMMTVIPLIAKQEGLAEEGYRVVVNCKKNGGQEVPHLHFHLLGGRRLTWPPG